MTEVYPIDDLKNSSFDLPELDPWLFSYHKGESTVLLLPSLHDQVYFSKLVSQVFKDHTIDYLLVELPEELEDEFRFAAGRLPVTTIIHDGNLEKRGELTLTPGPSHAYIIHPGECLYWAMYLAINRDIPIQFLDTWQPKAYASIDIPLDFVTLASVGWEQFWMESDNFISSHLDHPIHMQRSVEMSSRIYNIPGTSLLVCGAAHWPLFHVKLVQEGYQITLPNPIPETVLSKYMQKLNEYSLKPSDHPAMTKTWYLSDIHPHSLHLLIHDIPFHLQQFLEDPGNFDYLESIRQLYFVAERNYHTQFDDNVSPSAYQRMFQYLRNLGRVYYRPIPDLLSLVTVAKGMVDHDYAFEVFRVATVYLFTPSEDQKLDEMLKFTPDERQSEVIRFAFKRRFKRPVMQRLDTTDEYEDLDPIPEEEYPGQWKEIWDKYSPYGVVSYPPEDEFIENYMTFLRKRIIEILMEEESSSFEFESSLEDGIDWKATMRHFHEKKIYVKKYPRNKYQVGALIVQFLEEPFDTEEYGHHSTLFAEHDQESHISVITTSPGDIMVGPGITRVKYAAIVSQFPPVGWPYLITQENVSLKLRLIFAAMQMSLNKIIGFVAPKPPTAAQRHFAAEHGFRIVYLPMGQLTKASLHRLRTMHLLAYRDLRDLAREYIGF